MKSALLFFNICIFPIFFLILRRFIAYMGKSVTDVLAILKSFYGPCGGLFAFEKHEILHLYVQIRTQ